MADATRRAFRRGLATGLLLGVAGVGIPLLLLAPGREGALRPGHPLPADPAGPPGPPGPRGGPDGATARADVGSPPPGGEPRSPDEALVERDPGDAVEAPQEGPGHRPEDGADGGLPALPPGEGTWDRERELRRGLSGALVVQVLDAESGAPMAGIPVGLFAGTSRRGGRSAEARTGSDGTATVDPRGLLRALTSDVLGEPRGGIDFRTIGDGTDPLRVDVRIRLAGFRPFAAPASGSRIEVRLERDLQPRSFGALGGRLVDAADAEEGPWSRPAVVSLEDPELHDTIQAWAVPDADGRFRVTGLPAGPWDVAVGGDGSARVRVEIPPLGAAVAEFRVRPAGKEPSAALPEPRRPVVVVLEGRDHPLGAALLLDGGWGAPLRAEIAGGRSSFPSVPVGPVRAVLRRPDGPDETRFIDVPSGEGECEVPFDAPR